MASQNKQKPQRHDQVGGAGKSPKHQQQQEQDRREQQEEERFPPGERRHSEDQRSHGQPNPDADEEQH